MAHKAQKGSTKNGRDSAGRRLGIKKYAGELVKSGNIIVRQRGTRYRAGDNVMVGKDHTIFAVTEGRVQYADKRVKKFNSQVHNTKIVNVVTA